MTAIDPPGDDAFGRQLEMLRRWLARTGPTLNRYVEIFSHTWIWRLKSSIKMQCSWQGAPPTSTPADPPDRGVA
jgi:hypothetical protein